MNLFTPVDKRNRIFRAKTGTPSSRRTPTMPRGGYVRVGQHCLS
jgi:two-component system CheB/CheR fusion protein